MRNTMSAESNKALMRRFIEEVVVKGDLDLVDQLGTADFVGHSPGSSEPINGPETLKGFLSGYREIFPDLSVTIHQQISEGDMVATRFTESGTHSGMHLERPDDVPLPTGKHMEISGMVMAQIENGRLKETSSEWDMWEQVKQLGYLEAEPATS